MILASFSILVYRFFPPCFKSDSLCIVLTNIGNPIHTHRDTVGNSQVCKSQLLKKLPLLRLYEDGDRMLLLSTLCVPLTI